MLWSYFHVKAACALYSVCLSQQQSTKKNLLILHDNKTVSIEDYVQSAPAAIKLYRCLQYIVVRIEDKCCVTLLCSHLNPTVHKMTPGSFFRSVG